MTDPRKPTNKRDNVVEDRDADSRTVEMVDTPLNIQPDVDVNDRPDIMGDEGPVAETNPHNKAE